MNMKQTKKVKEVLEKSGYGKKQKKVIKFKIIFTLIVLACIMALIGIIVIMMSINTDDILHQYDQMNSKPNSSTWQFPHKYITIVQNDDGTFSISFKLNGDAQSDSQVSKFTEDPDDLDGDGIPDEFDPDPLIPNQCTCTSECTANSIDSSCEVCTANYNMCKYHTGTNSEPVPPPWSVSDQEFIDKMKSIGCTEVKAMGMLACYKAAQAAGMTSSQTIGLLACAMAEGSPGLVQYGYPQNVQSGSAIWKSTPNNPLYIDTAEKLQALKAIQNNSDNMGCGTAQWTNGRCETYLNKMEAMFGGQQTISGQDLYNLDYAMYYEELTGSYSSLVSNIESHNATLEQNVIYSMFKYEAGFGNYKGDSANLYGSPFNSYISDRLANATAIAAVMN